MRLSAVGLGGQWVSGEDKARTAWSTATPAKVEELSPRGEGMRGELSLVYSMVTGLWHELADPGEVVPRIERAVSRVLENQGVSSVLVVFASMGELEEAVGVREMA
jgi:hypothetical protein